jgi:hypothetical protein
MARSNKKNFLSHTDGSFARNVGPINGEAPSLFDRTKHSCRQAKAFTQARRSKRSDSDVERRRAPTSLNLKRKQ